MNEIRVDENGERVGQRRKLFRRTLVLVHSKDLTNRNVAWPLLLYSSRNLCTLLVIELSLLHYITKMCGMLLKTLLFYLYCVKCQERIYKSTFY